MIIICAWLSFLLYGERGSVTKLERHSDVFQMFLAQLLIPRLLLQKFDAGLFECSMPDRAPVPESDSMAGWTTNYPQESQFIPEEIGEEFEIERLVQNFEVFISGSCNAHTMT